jgi:hypothetical protein
MAELFFVEEATTLLYIYELLERDTRDVGQTGKNSFRRRSE